MKLNGFLALFRKKLLRVLPKLMLSGSGTSSASALSLHTLQLVHGAVEAACPSGRRLLLRSLEGKKLWMNPRHREVLRFRNTRNAPSWGKRLTALTKVFLRTRG